jgi:hypothetical protein
MPKAIDLTAVRRQLSDCLGAYPTITRILREKWEDGEITTEEMNEVLCYLLDMPSRVVVCGDKDPGPIERALRNRHPSDHEKAVAR